jgi:hypothetical protein
MSQPGAPNPQRTAGFVAFIVIELVGAATIFAGVLTENRALLGVGGVVLGVGAGLGIVNFIRDSQRRR